MSILGERLKSLRREPLAHFLVAGLLVFALASWRGTAVDPADRTITIDAPRVELLARQFEQTWQRSPNSAEIDQLIRDYVQEEVYYREALRLGLDQDDPVIRRRLRSKMEFLASSEVENAVPTTADLEGWFATHQARYAEGSRYSFEQVYLGPANADGARNRAARALAQIKAGRDVSAFAMPISLPPKVADGETDRIANDFGTEFAQQLPKLPVGQWTGPIVSGFGVHLVRVTTVSPGRPAKLEEVRQRVENDWREATGEERQARAYQALLDGYRVRISKP
ncbi:MAG: peptidyl-prolyl cis-trans isomerase [Chakrabartia sp.]